MLRGRGEMAAAVMGGGISESTTVNKRGEGGGERERQRERVRRDAWKFYL